MNQQQPPYIASGVRFMLHEGGVVWWHLENNRAGTDNVLGAACLRMITDGRTVEDVVAFLADQGIVNAEAACQNWLESLKENGFTFSDIPTEGHEFVKMQSASNLSLSKHGDVMMATGEIQAPAEMLPSEYEVAERALRQSIEMEVFESWLYKESLIRNLRDHLPPADYQEALRMKAAVRYAGRDALERVSCLELSLGTVLACAQLGRRVALVMGIVADPITFHAWPETKGQAVCFADEWNTEVFTEWWRI